MKSFKEHYKEHVEQTDHLRAVIDGFGFEQPNEFYKWMQEQAVKSGHDGVNNFFEQEVYHTSMGIADHYANNVDPNSSDYAQRIEHYRTVASEETTAETINAYYERFQDWWETEKPVRDAMNKSGWEISAL